MCFNPHNNFLYFVKSEGFLLNKRNSTFSLTLTVLSLNNKSGGNMENLQNIKFGYILSEQGGGFLYSISCTYSPFSSISLASTLLSQEC